MSTACPRIVRANRVRIASCIFLFLTTTNCQDEAVIDLLQDGIDVNVNIDVGEAPGTGASGDPGDDSGSVAGVDDGLDGDVVPGDEPPSDVVISGCEFTVTTANGGPLPDEIDSPRQISVEGTIFVAEATQPTTLALDLPADVTLIWLVDGETVSGSVEEQVARLLEFTTPGSHTVALSLSTDGSAVTCLDADTGQAEVAFMLLPVLSGTVTDESGAGIADATLTTDDGSDSDTTGDDGTFTLHVPFGWSGDVTVAHSDFDFSPDTWSVTNVTTDQQKDFVATPSSPGGTPSGPVACPNACNDGNPCTDNVCNNDGSCSNPSKADATSCDDGLFCNGTDACTAGVCGHSGDPCGLATCDENTGTCLCTDAADCPDDGNDCTAVDAICDAGVCSYPSLGAGDLCDNDTDLECDDPTCDGAGNCESHFVAVLTACGDANDTECDDPDTCDGAGFCLDNYETAGASCGDASDTACDDPDTCNGSGSCQANTIADGTDCPDGLFCNGPETCTGGVCSAAAAGCNPGEACVEETDTCVVGIGISGTISLVSTLGARPPIGPVAVIYTESGSGDTFTSTSDRNGAYTLDVPNGSSGKVTTDDTAVNHCFFLSPVEREYLALGENQTDQDFEAWCPPIGIPTPEFGIADSHHMYATEQFDIGSGLEDYRDAGDGPYTHYVDNSDPGCDDASQNGFGSPGTPLCKMPSIAPAGSVFEVHGGPYNANVGGGKIRVSSLGTAALPVFVRGVTGTTPTLQQEIILQGEYLVFENFHVLETNFSMRIQAPGDATTIDHVVVRSCDLEGENAEGGFGGLGVGNPTDGATPANVVVYNNHIHHAGDAEFFGDEGTGVSGEDDRHGVAVTYPAQDVWILDNHIHDNGGDSVQIGHNANFTTHHVYIGRNYMHDEGENGVDIKQADDVIVSQNIMHDFEEDFGSSPGEGFVVHFDPHRVWVLYNKIYNANIGLISTGCDPFFAIGNVVHDSSYRAIDFRGPGAVHVVGNTVSRSAVGIHADNGPNGAQLVNNVITNVTDPAGFHIDYENTLGGLSEMHHNLLFQNGNDLQIRWGPDYASVAAFQAGTGKGDGLVDADPLFVDVNGVDDLDGTGDDDFRLQVGSPAIDAGTALLPDTDLPNPGDGNDVYELFSVFYGITILFDRDWVTVPINAIPDIGAYEFEP